jgi:hypothetical protein
MIPCTLLHIYIPIGRESYLFITNRCCLSTGNLLLLSALFEKKCKTNKTRAATDNSQANCGLLQCCNSVEYRYDQAMNESSLVGFPSGDNLLVFLVFPSTWPFIVILILMCRTSFQNLLPSCQTRFDTRHTTSPRRTT